jgi:hypothetical protein
VRIKIGGLWWVIGTVVHIAVAAAREHHSIVEGSPHIHNRICRNFTTGPRLGRRLADFVVPLVHKNEILLSLGAWTRLSLSLCASHARRNQTGFTTPQSRNRTKSRFSFPRVFRFPDLRVRQTVCASELQERLFWRALIPNCEPITVCTSVRLVCASRGNLLPIHFRCTKSSRFGQYTTHTGQSLLVLPA